MDQRITRVQSIIRVQRFDEIQKLQEVNDFIQYISRQKRLKILEAASLIKVKFRYLKRKRE